MNKFLSCFLIIVNCLLLLGCQENPNEKQSDTPSLENKEEQNEKKSGGKNMNEIDIFDFENIGKAPEANETHDLDEVIKIFFTEWIFDDSYEPIAINIESNEIYKNPSLSLHSFSSCDEIIQISQAEEVLEILERYEVQTWERDYTFEDPNSYEDGYSWRLWLQFEDGSVEKHSGKGTDVEKLTPERYRDFVNELEEFTKEKLKESE